MNYEITSINMYSRMYVSSDTFNRICKTCLHNQYNYASVIFSTLDLFSIR